MRHRPSLAHLVLAAAVAGLTGACGSSGTATPPTLEPAVAEPGFFGINGQKLQPMAADGRAALLDRHLRAIAGLGPSFVRASFSWPAVEPGSPDGTRRRYDFRVTDAWVRALARHGLRWYVTLKGNPTPDWALAAGPSGEPCGNRAPPARERDYAALAAALARRYGRGGSYWDENPALAEHPVTTIEIWNEPNYGVFWCPQPDPDAYASLLVAAADAIHDVDPRARVILGGLAAFRVGAAPPGQPPRAAVPDFLAAVVRAAPGVRKRVAAIGVHPYGRSAAEALAKLAWLRAATREAGLGGVPLSVSESGWYVSGSRGAGTALSEGERATLLREVTLGVAASGCEIAELAAHTWVTPEQNPRDPEDWFGLADPASGEPYESARAYATALADLRAGRVEADAPDAVC